MPFGLSTLVLPEPHWPDVFIIEPSTNGELLWNVVACHVIYTRTSRSKVEMASSSQNEKAIFFNGLDQLDAWALEVDHEEIFDSATNSQHLYSPHITSSKPLVSQPRVANPQVRRTRVSRTTRSGSLAAPTRLKMSSSTLTRKSRSDKVCAKQPKKKKNIRPLKLQPEEAQIFRGLTFCDYTMSESLSLDHLTKARFLAQ